MSELTNDAASGGSEQTPVAVVTTRGEGKLSIIEAARSLAQARKPNEQNRLQAGSGQRAEGAAPDEPAQESASAATAASADAAPDNDQVRGETENADPGAQETDQALPPIEPPRSWTKEDKELFTSLPRETQERIAERERSRESDFLRRQNEAADKLKGLTAKEQAVDEARRSEEHTSELQSLRHLVCRLLLE